MKFVICIDKNNGISFFKKRQSTDGQLRAWLGNLISSNNAKLWVSSYTAKQFKDECAYIVDDDYLSKAGEQDYIFVEDKGFDVATASEFVICNWNRNYPADAFFKVDLKAQGFKRVKKEDIKGSSHDKITIEIYQKG